MRRLTFSLVTFSLATTVLLSSCAVSTTNYYTPSVQSWQGSQVNALVKQWGRPDFKVNAPGGGTTLAYKTESYSTYVPPSSPEVGVNATNPARPAIVVSQNTNNTWNRGSLSINCTVIFSANKQGIITNTKIMGHGCYGGETFAKKYANPSANVIKRVS